MRPTILSIYALFFILCFGCATPPPPKPAAKPYESCTCGPTLNSEGKPYCAIWGDNRSSTGPTKVWQSKPRTACEADDCSQLFSNFCKKIQLTNLPKPKVYIAQQPCYCDAVLLENDKGQIQLNCAAWIEGDENLLEYYALENCRPQRCREAPFYRAEKVCGNNFRAFYPPFNNRR